VKGEEKRGFHRRTKKPPPAIFYDCRNKKFKPAQIPEESLPSLQALLSGLKDQRQGLNGEMWTCWWNSMVLLAILGCSPYRIISKRFLAVRLVWEPVKV